MQFIIEFMMTAIMTSHTNLIHLISESNCHSAAMLNVIFTHAQ